MKHTTENNPSRFGDLELITTTVNNSSMPSADHLRMLAHDLQSAANAFHFTIETMASEKTDKTSERQAKKFSQLRQHVKLNIECIELVCRSLLNIKQQETNRGYDPYPPR
jgi:hypothetical protein